ncbi:DUF58 domain-containing protein [Angustibacter sp. McL0619]|uniref:DUF58 domain-containing protein n=1 Tax=Angustibacter sp. McL0619 TaxID=3415676 RepID=UPI003CEC3084
MALTGRCALLALLGVGWVALVQPSVAGVGVWLLVLATAIALDLLLAASPGRLTVTRAATGSVRLGEPTSSELTVLNSGRRRLRALVRDAWQPSAGASDVRQRLDVPAGERRRVSTALLARRRGDLRADRLTVRSLGPLRVAARQRSIATPGRLRVLPPFTSRKHLPSRLARLREIDGRSSVNVRGQGTEFDSLRDYVAGDDVRSIDWRATARRSEVLVRTWRPERDRRVVLVLDTSRTAAARVGDEPRLDAAMDAALLLAALASRAGDRVDLIAVDRRLRARVEGAGASSLLSALVSAMVPLQAELVEADWSVAVGAIAGRLTQRSLVVLLTSLDSAVVEEGLLPVLGQLTRRHQVVVASVADPEIERMSRVRTSAEDVYAAAAAERTRLERERVARLLGRLGADVVDASPVDLPPRLADRYLELKAAGRL